MPTKQETLNRKQAQRFKDIQVEMANPIACEIADENCWGEVTKVSYHGDHLFFCKDHRRP